MDFSTIKNNLEKKGYTVSQFETGAAAVQYLADRIKNSSVGIGGSMSAKQLGLYEKLSENNDVNWHWQLKEGQSPRQAYDGARNAEVYISSVNGIAETGEIINIDGSGNRVAETIYGHKKVYLLVGRNKIAPDFEKAMWRARNIAAPLNAKRLGTATPCAAKGDKCYDCDSPERICKAFLVFSQKPNMTNCEIVLISEDLGY
ncbi:MAG: lactate utilization protein [Oscillospiraceae bacterium]|nr:lactate utilization protein [Oscillospiraceae bacterium]